MAAHHQQGFWVLSVAGGGLDPSPAPVRDPAHSAPLPWAVILAAVGVLLPTLVLLLGVAMRRGINHDEHQFVAAAALVAREGLLPWRDFAYFHVPTLSYLNAALFGVSDSLLLSARLLSIGAAGGTLALLLGAALSRLRGWGAWQRLGAGSALVLLFLSTSGFLHAAGRAWNHDLPIFLSLAAFLLLLWTLERGRAAAWAGAAGLLLGLAVGTRLSFAPLLLPFGVAALLWRVPARRFWAVGLRLAGGVLLGLLPVLWTAALAPAQAWFGNFTYAALNTRFYREVGDVSATAAGKLADFGRFLLLQPGNLLLVTVTLVVLARARGGWRTPGLRFWLLLWPFLLLGALAPTPLQMQYVYVLLPFAALGIILGLAHEKRPRVGILVIAPAALIALIAAAPRFGEGLQIVAQPAEWSPVKVHERGLWMARLARSGGEGRIFTLSPVDPLEGGAQIDPRTATGPFAWRVAPLVESGDRAALGLLGEEEFGAALAAAPPRALLTGMHDDDDGPEATQVQWAQAHDYMPVAMPDEGVLWLSPIARWGDTISLGAHTLPEEPLAPGETFIATFYLQNRAPIATNLNVLVRAVNARGEEMLRSEGWPYGSATSGWETGEVWPDGHSLMIPADARPGVYHVELSFYDPSTLATLGEVATVGHLLVQSRPFAGEPLARFGGGLELLRATLPATARAGETVRLELIWRAFAPQSADYTVFAHVVAEDGALLAQKDQPPHAALYPTSKWRVGWPVDDSVEIMLPADAPIGQARVLVGLYDPATGLRLPLTGGGDSFVAASIEILP